MDTYNYRDLFEYSGDSIYIIDLMTYTVIDANQRAYERLGYERDELIGMKFGDIEVPLPEQEEVLKWESTNRDTHFYETRFRHRDGQMVHVEISTRTMRVGKKRQLIQIVARPIAARKNAQQAALEQQSANLLSAFIENAAHEFRTPLSTILSQTYLMVQYDDMDKRSQINHTIEHQVQRITNLVDILLVRAQLEQMDHLSYSRMNIAAMMQLVVHDALDKHDGHPSIKLHIDDDIPDIIANGDQLQNAFMHFLDNAMKYTSEDGKINVYLSDLGDDVQVEIVDDGIGIEDDKIDRIFDAFWRADSAHTTPGFGLGLSIAQKIIDQHNGQIIVESQIDMGTTFRILLPVSPWTISED